MLREKRELFDTIFSDVEPRRNLGLTQQEIFGLFKLRCPSGRSLAASTSARRAAASRLYRRRVLAKLPLSTASTLDIAPRAYLDVRPYHGGMADCLMNSTCW